MRFVPAVVGVLALSLLAPAASAFAPVAPTWQLRIAAQTLTSMPAAGLTKPLRTYRDVSWDLVNPPAAWNRFVTAAGGKWSASWDAATGIPVKIWGRGIPAPGAMQQPAVAEAVARQWLADHLDLLAPGSVASEFELRSNSYDGNIRSVGFAQRTKTLLVVGGQIGFEFKNDRLFVIGSTAYPNVNPPAVRVHTERTKLRAIATDQLRTQLLLPDAPVTDDGGEVVIPLVGATSVLGYRVVAPMHIDGGTSGRYLAYVDVESGAPLAVVQQNLYEGGTVTYNGVHQYPGNGYGPRPAPGAHVSVGATAETTGSDGSISVPAGGASVTTAVSGDFATMVNFAGQKTTAKPKDNATTTLPIQAGGSVLWDATAVEFDDAQVQAYLDVNIVKGFIRDHIDPNMATLDDPLITNVNIDDQCNAFFDGTAINFFHATAMCQNTALVQDVGFHEIGHDLHQHEIVDGVGAFDGAMSEGAADFLAVNITGDSGLGRGFFYTDEPLRQLDPPKIAGHQKEWTWPTDIGEIHHTGLIFGGTWWDLRTAFHDLLGDDAGEAKVLALYVGALRRSVDIPSSLVEALATDDDDGDLSNGTPNECLIRGVFGAHGLTTATGFTEGAGATGVAAASTEVRFQLTGLSQTCPGDTPVGLQVLFDLGSGSGSGSHELTGSVNASRLADTTTGFFAQLPLVVNGDVLYSAQVEFSDNGRISLPDNLADTQYQLYSGTTVPLYCTSFETDPFAEGWTTGTGDSSPSPWEWGVPTGGATDPHAAFSGTHALVQALNGDYQPSTYSVASTPEIDTGHYSDVRVQYRRWLASEDSHFDQATITANGNTVWINATADQGDSSALQHIDKEWRFHDVPLSGHFHGHTLSVGWSLQSDPGLELGGWALDDVCIVANPDSICGDGVVSATEECDDGVGNADRPNACRSDCSKARCGDGIVDDGEECDDGEQGGGATCSPTCKLKVISTLGGCSAGGQGPAGPLALCALTGLVGAVLRRRRRAA